jgi:hypothetical protein
MRHQPAKQGNAMRRQIYLLTCWQERDELAGEATWRFNLETPGASKRRLFTNLQEVMGEVELDLKRETQTDE